MASRRSSVTLRQRTTSADGRQSLYLDIYTGGRKVFESLGLFLVPERTREDREANRQTLAIAEEVRNRRLSQIRAGVYGTGDVGAEEATLLGLFDEEGHSVEGRWPKWRNCRKHILAYTGGRDVPLRSVTRQWVEGFAKYLDGVRDISHADCPTYERKPLAQGTKGMYLAVLKTCLAAAVRRGLIDRSPAQGVSVKAAEPRRVYLTLDEVRAMAAAECRYPALKRAFLFSCLTGLRKSDILALTWAQVETQGGFTRLVFRQRKTGGQEYLDISPQAVEFMGGRGRPEERVFGLFYNDRVGDALREWARSAGVAKRVTFHSGRHTFAVLMLDLGADIYTVQKLLGHRELRTTQIYADLLDKKKQAAVLLIPQIVQEG